MWSIFGDPFGDDLFQIKIRPGQIVDLDGEKMKKISNVAPQLISSTQWEKQWSVEGSRGNYYKVSQHQDSTFACACKAWTTTTPREDCKHILLVRLQSIQQTATPQTNTTVSPVNQITQVTGRRFR
jgi:hypothetical protein